MKKILTLLGLMLSCIGLSQNLSAKFMLDIRDGEIASAVSTKLATIEDIFNIKGVNPDFNALAGVKFKTNQTVGGFDLTFSIPAGKNLLIQPGAALLFNQKTPTSFGLVLGATIVQPHNSSFSLTGSPVKREFGFYYSRKY